MSSFFCTFHALSFELNFFRPEVPFKLKVGLEVNSDMLISYFISFLPNKMNLIK